MNIAEQFVEHGRLIFAVFIVSGPPDIKYVCKIHGPNSAPVNSSVSGDKILGIWQWVKEVTVKIFWPWFKEFVWPFIRQHMKDLIFFVIDLFKEELKKWASEQAKKKTENANQKADEFEQKAKSSQKDEEADKFRAVAQVWREVAEQFRQENESLRNKIDGLSEDVKEEAFAKADSLEIDLDFSDEKAILSIGDAVHKLPQLPAGDNKEKG